MLWLPHVTTNMETNLLVLGDRELNFLREQRYIA